MIKSEAELKSLLETCKFVFFLLLCVIICFQTEFMFVIQRGVESKPSQLNNFGAYTHRLNSLLTPFIIVSSRCDQL